MKLILAYIILILGAIYGLWAAGQFYDVFSRATENPARVVGWIFANFIIGMVVLLAGIVIVCSK